MVKEEFAALQARRAAFKRLKEPTPIPPKPQSPAGKNKIYSLSNLLKEELNWLFGDDTPALDFFSQGFMTAGSEQGTEGCCVGILAQVPSHGPRSHRATGQTTADLDKPLLVQ